MPESAPSSPAMSTNGEKAHGESPPVEWIKKFWKDSTEIATAVALTPVKLAQEVVSNLDDALFAEEKLQEAREQEELESRRKERTQQRAARKLQAHQRGSSARKSVRELKVRHTRTDACESSRAYLRSSALYVLRLPVSAHTSKDEAQIHPSREGRRRHRVLARCRLRDAPSRIESLADS